MLKGKRILVLAPHTDDGEFGCGGSIHKLISNNEVFYAGFSSCQISVPDGFREDVLVEEAKKATRSLGIKNENFFLFDYEVRSFDKRRQEILDEMLRLKKEVRPDLILLPSANDVHQDHIVIVNEGIRAFKFSTILGYELPWNNLSFKTSCFVQLETENVEAKCTAITSYKSQAGKPYADRDFILSLAKVRGVQAGSLYAEAFEVIRWLI